MKNLVIALSFLFAGITYAQDANESAEISEIANLFALVEPTDYVLNDQIFNFTPDENTIKVLKVQGDEKIVYGTLRKSTDDGLYILTCLEESDDVSYGRFDENGNFVCNRFDMETESVIEESYTLANVDRKKAKK